MIPKLNACLTAAVHKTTTCIVDGRQPHALLNAIESDTCRYHYPRQMTLKQVLFFPFVCLLFPDYVNILKSNMLR
jgi:hypothetical protein